MAILKDWGRCLPFFILSVVLGIVTAGGCDSDGCREKSTHNKGDYVQCEMCACEKLCHTRRPKVMYECFVSVKKEDCEVTMKDEWIATFVLVPLFIICSCCVCCYCFLVEDDDIIGKSKIGKPKDSKVLPK